MPFLRFSRDKRGYENTYVLHTYRRDGRDHPRLLYWFRTPPGVRVGRFPLDERAIKAIEEGYPNLKFDWSEMLKVRPMPPPSETRRPRGRKSGTTPPPARRQKRPRGGAQETGDAGGRGRAAAQAPEETAAAEEAARPVAGPSSPDETGPRAAEMAGQTDPAAAPVDGIDVDGEARDGASGLQGGERDQESDIGQPVEELVAEATGELTVELEQDEEPGPDEPWQHPVVTLMGEEMLARLRARYAEIRLRISEKEPDPETLESIESRAKALDPDRWKTVEDAVQGIERFEAEAEAVRKALGRRPPRSRRSE